MLEGSICVLARSFLADAGGTLPTAELLLAVRSDYDRPTQNEDQLTHLIEEVLGSLVIGGSPLVRVGDEIVDVTLVAEGTNFTHRLTTEEVAEDRLDLSIDLAVIARVATADGGLHLSDATPLALHQEMEDGAGRGGTPRSRRSLVGPHRWLAEWNAGTVMAVSASEGYLTIAAAESERAGDASAVAASVRTDLEAAFDIANEGDGSPVFAEELQAAWLTHGWTTLDESTPPFADIVTAAGFEVSGIEIGRPGGWEAHARLGIVIQRIGRHGDHLGEPEHRALAKIVQAFDAWIDDPDTPAEPRVFEAMRAHAGAAMCLEEELIRTDPGGQRLEVFLGRFDEATISRRARPVYEGLRSLAAELQGDVAGAEAAVDAALTADPSWYAAMDRRIRFHELRGEVRQALSLLQRAREPGDTELQMMAKRIATTTVHAGRNEPCPCGSGRKFKHCHLGQDSMLPAQRVSWLLDKARHHVDGFEPALVEAIGRGQVGGELAPLDDDTQDLIAVDMALFESDGLAHFLTNRRSLLPAVEVELVEGWIAGHRASVYRVAAMADDGVVLVDQRDGQTLTVQRTSGWDGMVPHDLVWCRLLPDAGRWWISGIVRPINLAGRAAMLAATEAGPHVHFHAVVGDLPTGSSGAEPASDGQPRVEATATWRTPAANAEIEATLEQLARRADDGNGWEVMDDAGEVTASLLLLGADSAEDNDADDGEGPMPIRLLAFTDSILRHRAIQDRMAQWFPAAVAADAYAIPIARVLSIENDDDLLSEVGHEGHADWDDDEEWGDEDNLEPDDRRDLEEAIAEMTAQFEESWPTTRRAELGDRTALEAVQDPESVADVLVLLRAFERRGAPGSANRLRARLGLDPL